MRRLFSCFAPPSDSSRSSRAQKARSSERRLSGIGCNQGPSGVDTTGGANCADTDVLHCVEGECCDLLFICGGLQDPSIRALLEHQELLKPDHSTDRGGAFLRNLLGAERAQAAVEAVQQGVPYKTVLERELPAEMQPTDIHGLQHPLVPAQLASKSRRFPWPSEVTSEGAGSIEQSQEEGKFGSQACGQQAPPPPVEEAPNPTSTTKPNRYNSSSGLLDSQLSASLFVSGDACRNCAASVGSSTFWSSSGSPPSTLPTQGSSFSLQHQSSSSCTRNSSFPLPTLGSPTCSKAPEQQRSVGQPCPAPVKAKLDADLSQSLISKAQGLSNTALELIQGPGCENHNSGDYDRTLAMLQILQLDHSPATSNQPLPSFPHKTLSNPNVSIPYPLLDSIDGAVTCLNLGSQHGAASTAHTPGQDAGLYIETLNPALGSPLIHPSPADKDYPAAAQFLQVQALVSEDKGPCVGCPPSGSSLRAERPLMNNLEDIAEEKSCASIKSSCKERQSSPDSLESHARGAFEVSIKPVQTEAGRAKPLAMVKFADISDQMQVQGFLLSLAESQLLLLSSLLPKHAIDFLARQSSATDAIPQNMAKLARSHEAVTLLFMDICGYTTMAKSVEPQEIMALLNTLFSTLDMLTDKFKVNKVETAGDCYIVSAGVLSNNSHHGFSYTLDHHDAPETSARRVMEFAKALLQEAAKITMPRSTDPVQVRVGMHTGNVVSGLIGTKLPKWSLFGDTMNTAARMESTGVPGRIHVSETTHGLLPEYAWESVGLIPVKGKGNMLTYFWDAFKSWSGQPSIDNPRHTSHDLGVMLPIPPVMNCLMPNEIEEGGAHQTAVLEDG